MLLSRIERNLKWSLATYKWWQGFVVNEFTFHINEMNPFTVWLLLKYHWRERGEERGERRRGASGGTARLAVPQDSEISPCIIPISVLTMSDVDGSFRYLLHMMMEDGHSCRDKTEIDPPGDTPLLTHEIYIVITYEQGKGDMSKDGKLFGDNA